jgi:hypothetical protein
MFHVWEQLSPKIQGLDIVYFKFGGWGFRVPVLQKGGEDRALLGRG